MKHFTVTGALFTKDPKALGVGVKSALQTCGFQGQQIMKGVIDKDISASGKLRDSVVWKMKDNGVNVTGKANPSYELSKPSDPYAVHIGTAEEHAIYVEKGSHTHITNTNSDVFIERMKEWCATQLNIHWNGAPEERSAFWAIVQHIRKNGTKAQPFLESSLLLTEKTTPRVIENAIHEFIKQMGGE